MSRNKEKGCCTAIHDESRPCLPFLTVNCQCIASVGLAFRSSKSCKEAIFEEKGKKRKEKRVL
jgi:hypothetical protein